jgi:rhamnogalacturonan endolyase
LYPIHRTAVTGQLKISHGRSAAYAYVILGQPDNIASGRGGGMRNGAGEIGAGAGTRPSGAGPSGAGPSGGPEAIAGRGGARRDEAGRGSRGGTGAVVDRAAALYNQAGDYIFFVQADADGRFTLPAVRPGTYTLYAWQTQGPITQSLAKDGIEVKGEQLDLGVVDWDPPYHPHLLWQIGKADRMAGEFKFGDLPRTNQRIYQVPSDLTFTIGKSRASEDWYYAQRGGTWTVNFDVPNPPTGNAYLTIAIAGGSGNNGDDASVRRAANRSGRYGRNEYVFPAKLIRAGANSLALRSNSAGASGGLMYDTIVLEAD